MRRCLNLLSLSTPVRPRLAQLAEQTGASPINANQKSQKPYAVYVVEGEGEEVFCTKVGAAWPHEDGKGFNISLSRCP